MKLTLADEIACDETWGCVRQDVHEIYALGLRAGLERAAKVCDDEADASIPGAQCSVNDRERYDIAAGCAAAIRKLMEE